MVNLITIEREFGCGASEIARDVANQLGWNLWDVEGSWDQSELEKIIFGPRTLRRPSGTGSVFKDIAGVPEKPRSQTRDLGHPYRFAIDFRLPGLCDVLSLGSGRRRLRIWGTWLIERRPDGRGHGPALI
jgi:hypothetical protein